jgi:hypothetical protein
MSHGPDRCSAHGRPEIGDGGGSLELGLVAALVHGGSPIQRGNRE